MSFILPSSDDTTTGWSVVPGGDYWAAVDDTAPGDTDFVISPAMTAANGPPLIFGLDTPLYTLGKYYINIRANATEAGTSSLGVTLLDANSNPVSATVWVLLTSTNYITYKIVATSTAVATKIKIETKAAFKLQLESSYFMLQENGDFIIL